MSESYFAFPRLIAKWRGQSVERSEKNAWEAYVAGGLTHLIVYVAAFEMLLGDRSLWLQLLLLVPLAALVFLGWIIFFYLSARLLDVTGLVSNWPRNRAQNVIVGIWTTVLAVCLVRAGSCPAILGWIWMSAVALNLFAAGLLSASRHVELSANR